MGGKETKHEKILGSFIITIEGVSKSIDTCTTSALIFSTNLLEIAICEETWLVMPVGKTVDDADGRQITLKYVLSTCCLCDTFNVGIHYFVLLFISA